MAVRGIPVDTWPGWLGFLVGFKVPRGVKGKQTASPSGGASTGILLDLLSTTMEVDGDVAECGVFRGRTVLPVGLHLAQIGSDKALLAFDSFEGFGPSVATDQAMGGARNEDKRLGGFGGSSLSKLEARVGRWGLDSTITLIKGYFQDTLSAYGDHRFAFVHLDCDLYESYKTCLEFFYPRLSPGAVVLLDEYNDPPWPGCNKAVDEFLNDKPESLEVIERDNYQKWFFRKTVSDTSA